MKKLLIAASLLTLTSTAAFADTTGTLLLLGIVQKKLSIVVTATTEASALNLGTSASNLKVAGVAEQSNSKGGYQVTLKSANAGKLKRSGSSDVFSYSLKYAGAAVDLSQATGSIVTNTATAGVVNVNKDITISYTGAAAETMLEGEYSDTLTLNIATN